MSPQDDVNRRFKLATAFTKAQQNFALDSNVHKPNPAGWQKSPIAAAPVYEKAAHQRCAARPEAAM